MDDDLTLEYLRAAAEEWSTLKAGDAAMPLTDVFVLLEAVERPKPRPLESRPDLLPAQERLEHTGAEHPETERVKKPVLLSQALREARHLVLLGEPGAGKTTTLQYIALWFARRAIGEAAGLHADLGVAEALGNIARALKPAAGWMPILSTKPSRPSWRN